jgi:hypothetical protein
MNEDNKQPRQVITPMGRGELIGKTKTKYSVRIANPPLPHPRNVVLTFYPEDIKELDGKDNNTRK